MKLTPVHHKATQQSTAVSISRPVTGPNGVAIAPPTYGIDFVDRQQTAVSGSQALDATIQRRQPREDSSIPERQQENRTGLPDHLKAGIETLSGLSLDDVKVHYNSTKPAALQALAYTQGTDIHVGSGQEQHLPHEAWHVVQQKQGRVQPTMQMKDGIPVNDDAGLEHEANVMGATLSRLGRSEFKARIGDNLERAHVANHTGIVSQRMPVVQRVDPWDPAANALEVGEANAQNARLGLGVAAPHPIAIGPQQIAGLPPTTTGNQKHFDADMLKEVRNVLNYLPPAHIIGNSALTRVVMEHATAANPGVSYFGGGQLHIVVPFDASSWIYLSMSKWPVGDLATTPMTNIGYAQNPNNPNLGSKWYETFNRDVVGTGTIANKVGMLGEPFVRWLLRHETGHSVDQAIGFTANRHYRLPALGSWLIHDGTDTSVAAMEQRMLNALGLLPVLPSLDAAFLANTGQTYSALLQNATNNHDPDAFDVPGKRAARNAFGQGHGVFAPVANGAWKAEHLEEVVLEGLDSPWQKGNKGGIPLANRTYHVEYQHTRWVSYDSAKYPLRNSNYQFSGPDEWFAETYAHYFSHRSLKFWQAAAQQWGTKLHDPAARAWFLANLDPINGAGALIVGNVLQNMGVVAPAMPGQNAVVVPNMWQRVWNATKDVTATFAKVGVSGLFRLLSTVFLLPLGILKYLLWVPLKWLWRKILSFF